MGGGVGASINNEQASESTEEAPPDRIIITRPPRWIAGRKKLPRRGPVELGPWTNWGSQSIDWVNSILNGAPAPSIAIDRSRLGP